MGTFARTALLGLVLATVGVASEASAQNTVAAWVGHMPWNGGQRFDQNRDGRADFIAYDTNRDGRIDAARQDGNLDGYLEMILLDTNRNGDFDQIIYDTNRDGHFETAWIDSNHDGFRDHVGYDPNRTGFYTGWRPFPTPAPGAQQGGGGLNLSISGPGSDVDVRPNSAANQAFHNMWSGAATHASGSNAWARPAPSPAPAAPYNPSRHYDPTPYRVYTQPYNTRSQR